MNDHFKFELEQSLLAVTLAHLLKCALNGEDPYIWHDRARDVLAKYKASREAESAAIDARREDKNT